MTDTVTIHPDDRALWDRYVRSRRGAPSGAKEAGPVGGADAALIAAYVDLRLSEWERAAFEGRLVDEPALLDAMIAARGSASVAAPAVPQALTAFALNLAPPPQTRRGAERLAPTGRGRFLAFPRLGVALATFAFLCAFGVGAYVTWQVMEPPVMAQKGKEPAKEDIPPRNDSIFDDPAQTIFDGLDVKE